MFPQLLLEPSCCLNQGNVPSDFMGTKLPHLAPSEFRQALRESTCLNFSKEIPTCSLGMDVPTSPVATVYFT